MNNFKKPIDILVSCDNKDQILFDTFIKTSFSLCNLEQDFTIHQYLIDVDSSIQDYGYLSNRYINARIQQIKNIIKYLQENIGLIDKKSKSYAISMDSDIVLFPYFKTKIYEIITDDQNIDVDIYFMSENANKSLPNIGFIIFAINSHSLEFFESLHSALLVDKKNNLSNISKLVPSILKDLEINYKILDFNFANNNYNPSTFNKILNNNQLACFHATSTFDLLAKVEALSTIIHKSKKYTKCYVAAHSFQGWMKMLKDEGKIFTIEDSDIKKKCIAESYKHNPIDVYINYIIDNYDSLDDYTFFISESLFSDINLIKYLIPEIKLDDICDLCSLRGGVICLGVESTTGTSIKLDSKPYPIPLSYFLDNTFFVDSEELADIQCCSSDCYLVRKKNILNRSKQFYQHLLEFIQSNEYNYIIVEKFMLKIFDLNAVIKTDSLERINKIICID